MGKTMDVLGNLNVSKELKMACNPSAVVLLIHGTWARAAAWVQPDSPLAVALRSSLAPGTRVEAFDWTGVNTVRARRAAAAELVEKLSKYGPAIPIAIVAHSHGGSVVAYAEASCPAAFKNVRTVICMATPFFGFSPRPGYRALLFGILVSLSFLGFQATFLGLYHLLHRLDYRIGERLIRVWLAGILVLALWIYLSKWIWDREERVFSRFGKALADAAEFDTTRKPITNATFIRSMGDEVGLGLGVLQLSASLSNRTLNLIARIMQRWLDWVRHPKWKPLNYLFLWTVGILVLMVPDAMAIEFGWSFGNLRMDLNPWSSNHSFFDPPFGLADNIARAAYALGVMGMLLGFVATSAFAIMTMVSVLASWLVATAFGIRSFVFSLVAECAVEPTPEGLQRFYNAGWERDALKLRSDRMGLRHSEPYTSAPVTAWVKGHIQAMFTISSP